MKLSRKRQIFSQRFAQMITWGVRKGYDCVIDEVRRGRQQAEWNATHCKVYVQGKRCEVHKDKHNKGHKFRSIGIKSTIHGNGLAGDLLVFLKGVYLRKTEEYKAFGEYWENFSGYYDGEYLEFCWGGRFRDGGHFSIAHRGRK